jgi:hypothetical protein
MMICLKNWAIIHAGCKICILYIFLARMLFSLLLLMTSSNTIKDRQKETTRVVLICSSDVCHIAASAGTPGQPHILSRGAVSSHFCSKGYHLMPCNCIPFRASAWAIVWRTSAARPRVWRITHTIYPHAPRRFIVAACLRTREPRSCCVYVYTSGVSMCVGGLEQKRREGINTMICSNIHLSR